ncbi:uncharacterized protein yc1106_01320 [Curvularia clavata]|uniref:Zinc finger Mcm10/DnaG-type domain-containing protein n=1 Tax=Curvularia clavata TaxID=95742 RepID=A0A9Q9DQ64_CURCL|nr:uncharacterized protein yc1106_01320 [Curvularia clavata]
MIVRESPKSKAVRENQPNWPPQSSVEALLSSPSGRRKYERSRQRNSVSPSPTKRRPMSRDHAQPDNDGDDDDDDEETLRLQLQAIEAKLKLKALQKKKAESAEAERNGASSRASIASAMRRTEPTPLESTEEAGVQVPRSPIRARRQPDEPKSPARVMLGIDKGLTARDVSLKRPSSVLAGRTRAGSIKDSETPKIKSFSERIAESRNREKDREEKEEKAELRRNRGFGLHTIEGLTDRPSLSRQSSSQGSETRSSRDMPPPTPRHRHQSRSVDLRIPPSPRPGSTLSFRNDISRPLSSSSKASSSGFGSTPIASKYAEMASRDDSTDGPSFEPFSGLHLKSREMQHNVVTRTLEGKTVLTIPQLLKTVKAPEYDPPDWENDYVVLGVICYKSTPHDSKNAARDQTKSNQDKVTDPNGKFMVIKLTDLKWELDLFLFDTGFSQFWKLPLGTVVAILNPDIMPPRNRDTGKFSLKLSSSDDTILEIGTARDLDFCNAKRKDGKDCGQWIDGRKTEFCEFHIQLQVDKAKKGRMQVNTMTGFGGGPGGGKFGMFGRGGSFKGDELKREGKYHDRELHETVYIAPRPGGAARLIDRDQQNWEGGVNREERFRKQLAEREKERELAKKLGTMGDGTTGADYLRLKGAGTPSLPSRARPSSQMSTSAKTDKPAETDFSSLLNRKSTTSSDPVGWAFKYGRIPSPKKVVPSAFRGTREASPAKKRARLLLDGKGIREPGRESLGGLDAGLIAALDDDDDDDLEGSHHSPRTGTRSREKQDQSRGLPASMASAGSTASEKIYALINYEDPYVQPLILSALEKRIPSSSYELISSLSQLPSPSSRLLQFVQYESIDFDHLMDNASTSLANAYVIRKALIRKHYLSTTIANWITKYPDSILKKHVKPSVEFEVDYAEFLDDALVEAWELKESWARNEELGDEEEDLKRKEWWILKPGMSDRGQGIRLFSSEQELTEIFEEWDPESDDENEDEDARSDSNIQEEKKDEEDNGIITSQLRHFIAQPYIHPPLLLSPPNSPAPDSLRKFHIRTYVLATGALKLHVYRPMLALFAAKPYLPPWSATVSQNSQDAMRAHLTNTCLQDSGDREGSVALFWDLPDTLPAQPDFSAGEIQASADWKTQVFDQICGITAATFEAAARGMSIHFQPLPNAFEIFGLDFMVSVEKESGELRTWLLEVNAFPDFRQTGGELQGLVQGLMDGVVDVGIRPFFGLKENEDESMVKVLDVDLGKR